MKFKHTFHVFVDNFSIVYKQLLYRLVIMAIFGSIGIAVIYPFVTDLINSEQLKLLIDNAKEYIVNLLNGNFHEVGTLAEKVIQAYNAFWELLRTKFTSFVLSCLLVLLVLVVSKWFEGLGNYATAAAINDKMALRAQQPFFLTLVRNLKEAAIYNAIYVPLSTLYDLAIGTLMFFLLFFLLNNVLYTFICIFLFVLAIVVSIVIKMTFTTDWLPAIIRGKKGQLGSFKYTFAQKGKNTLGVMSNFAVIVLLIFSINVLAVLTTFGVGLLLTIPSSYVLLICYELVNYYDREGLKYFIDKNTIVSTEKERPMSREEFFKGDGGEK